MRSAIDRYLFVIGHYGHMGGAERQAFHLIRHLREQRDAPVAALGWYGTAGPLAEILREWGCEVFTFPYQSNSLRVSKALNLYSLARFIRSNIRPDVILPFVAIHSKPICQIWRMTGARYAWWNQQDEGRGLFGTTAERKALLNAVHITSNSWAGTNYLEKVYGIPPKGILTYNNGTNLPDLATLRPVWRRALGVSVSTPLVIMAANVTPFKDHVTLLKSWRTVLDHYQTVRSDTPVLALAGHLKDSHHVNKLKVLAFDLNLGNSVRLLGSIESLNELMWESDLVVHSSVTEGCPNAVCEAMALAKPVIATDIPGTRQALEKKTWRECLVAPEEPSALGERILKFLSQKDLAVRMGEINRERIRDHFSIEGMNQTLTSLFDRTGSLGIQDNGR